MHETSIDQNAVQDQVHIIHVKGPLDRCGAARLRLQLLSRLASGCQQLVLNVRKVPYIDSDGIRALRDLVADWGEATFRLINVRRNVRRTLSLIRLDRLIASSDTTEESESEDEGSSTRSRPVSGDMSRPPALPA